MLPLDLWFPWENHTIPFIMVGAGSDWHMLSGYFQLLYESNRITQTSEAAIMADSMYEHEFRTLLIPPKVI